MEAQRAIEHVHYSHEIGASRSFEEAVPEEVLERKVRIHLNDANADVHPGASQICDAVNNDCDHPAWPELTGTNEADDDGDGFSECAGDCDHASAAIGPHAVELPGNRIDENLGVLLCDPDAEYRSRGELIQCVSRTCRDLMSEGLATREQCRDLHHAVTGKPSR